MKLAIFCLTSLLAPVFAKYISEIMSALLDEQVAKAMKTSLEMPSALTPYTQWVKNLNQIGIFVLIILAGKNLHNHLFGGQVPLVLSRYVGRSAYLTGYFLSFLVVIFFCLVFSTGLVWLVTSLFFDSAPIMPLLSASLIWFLFSALILSFILFIQVASTRFSLGLVSGFFLYLLINLGEVWSWGGERIYSIRANQNNWRTSC